MPSTPGVAGVVSVTLPPRLEVMGHRRHHLGVARRAGSGGGAVVEAGAERGVPLDVVARLHLVREEAGEQQTLGPGRLHHFGIVGESAVEDVAVEDT